MNLSSIVVLTKPENLEEVLASIKSSDFCEYHLHDEKGRIIVTVEGITLVYHSQFGSMELILIMVLQFWPHLLDIPCQFYGS